MRVLFVDCGLMMLFVSAQIGTSASFASACRLSSHPSVPSLQLILISSQSREGTTRVEFMNSVCDLLADIVFHKRSTSAGIKNRFTLDARVENQVFSSRSGPKTEGYRKTPVKYRNRSKLVFKRPPIAGGDRSGHLHEWNVNLLPFLLSLLSPLLSCRGTAKQRVLL